MENLIEEIETGNWLVEEKHITAKVIDIRWERIFLTLDVELKGEETYRNSSELRFYGVKTKSHKADVCFKIVERKGDVVSIRLNITNNGQNICIHYGKYCVFVCDGNDILAECLLDTKLVPRLMDLSRNFLYNGFQSIFAVTFFVDEDLDQLPFRMHILPASKCGEGFPKTARARGYFKLKSFVKDWGLGHKAVLRRIYKFYSLLYRGKADRTVLFLTEQNDKIASNLKAVSERMAARGLDKEYQILYSARPAAAVPQGIKSWIRVMKLMAQSNHIFIDDHAPVLDWLKLRDETEVVQLWHAGAGFKSSGYSRWGHMGCPKPQSCHRQYKYGIAGSKNIAHFFSEVWGINDERVLPTGMPRMDEYLDQEHKKKLTEELYQKYPASRDKKVILFAPTYRGRNKKTAFYPYELLDFDKFYEVCGDEYIVFFKAHPWCNNQLEIKEEHRDKFFDVKDYPNINDLFYITDLLITDYSSNIFEYSLMRRPMLFFAFDKVEYSLSRGFHRDYDESAPGKVCETFAELMEAIEKKDFEFEKVEQYVEYHFDYIDSGASDRVIDWILLGNMPEDLKKAIDKVDEQNIKMRDLRFAPPEDVTDAASDGGEENEEQEEQEES